MCYEKRAGLAQILDGFETKKIALYDEKKLQSLLKDDRAIKNRLKIYSLPKMPRLFRSFVPSLVRFIATSINLQMASAS